MPIIDNPHFKPSPGGEEGPRNRLRNQAKAVADSVRFEDREPEEYADLVAQYDGTFKQISAGEILRGKVLKVTDKEVIVDVGYKSEGAIPLHEFRDEGGQIHVAAGDQIDVFLEDSEDVEGYIVLSLEKASRMKIWGDIERAYQQRSVLTGRVIERIKGGLAVDIGVRAFLPGSQIDLRPVRNLDSWKGEELRVKVIKLNKRRGNIVLSRKAVLEEELEQNRRRILEVLEEGRVVDGTVKNITEYGAFVDLGGIDGLLHITDMSWGRINHPSELFRIGDRVKVKVLKFDREEKKVSLGYKQLSEDPWVQASQKYPRHSRVRGRVVSITDYGAFVELEPGMEGLIHISEMTWNKRIKHPSKILSVGDAVEVVVLEIDPSQHRVSLGLKQTEPNPWALIERKYGAGSVISGRVRNLTDFGIFVEVEEGIDGLVHVSDISRTKKVKHPSELFKKGDQVECVVLNIDVENQKLSLGIKQLEPDRWEPFFSRRRVGEVVSGKVMRITKFGLFVELEEGIEGLCHVSELGDKRVQEPEELFSVGQNIEAKIIKLNPAEKRIGLSIKALKDEAARAEVQAYVNQAASGAFRLGDLAGKLGAALEGKEDKE
ncbi:MAG: 30S ribosomal protein S1 [Acidobacteria bacterium]|nr:30S ribosomal protein S1 [Acidobacteriota bacterium]